MVTGVVLFQDHLNLSVEITAVHAEVAGLEAKVFAQVCPLFDPPACDDDDDGNDLCSECDCSSKYDLCSGHGTPERDSPPPPLPPSRGRDSGLEMTDGCGMARASSSPAHLEPCVPLNEAVLPPHKVLMAMESGISSDGSYLTLHDHDSAAPTPPVGFAMPPTSTAESARVTPLGISLGATPTTQSTTRLPQKQTVSTAPSSTISSQEWRTVTSRLPTGRSHDPPRVSHDQRIVTARVGTRIKTKSIETEV